MTWKVLAASVLVVLTGACAAPYARPAPFRVRPDSVRQGDLRGPFTGRVVDAETDRPVAGALVFATWTYVQGVGLTAPGGYRQYVGSTDANGAYRIPRLAPEPRSATRRLADFHVIIYKKGYVAYRSDRRFDDLGPRLAFAQLDNRIDLDRWRSDLSHVAHLRYVGGGGPLAALTAWEVPEAAAELSGARRVVAASEPPPTGWLDARTLITPEDVKKVTGFDGTFDVAELGDQPLSSRYANVHLRAEGLTEAHDVALRVWRLDMAGAQVQFGQLVQELPNVEEPDELGDRSLRATSDNREIFAIAWMDGRRGVVALLTCGASQCHSHDTVLELARLIRDRLEDRQGGTP